MLKKMVATINFIHIIVIGVFATLLLNLNIPAVVKYLILIVSAYYAIKRGIAPKRKSVTSQVDSTLS